MSLLRNSFLKIDEISAFSITFLGISHNTYLEDSLSFVIIMLEWESNKIQYGSL